MKIPFHFEPRDYQIPIMRGFGDSKLRYIIMNWARRNGKDMTCWNASIAECAKRPQSITYIFPTLDQGRKALWENIENDGFRSIDHIPKDLVARIDNAAMSIEFRNGSILRIQGVNDDNAVERLRGGNSRIYVLSEFADIHPNTVPTILPIVGRNGGKIIINGTPKLDGINGAAFKKMYDIYRGDPIALVSKRDAIGVASKDELDFARESYINRYGNDFMYRQEYLLDWGQVSSGSYYGDKLSQIERRGQMGTFPYNRSVPVYTSWDLGVNDDTAIVFFQVIDKRVRVIDFFAGNNVGTHGYVNYVKSKSYEYAEHFFPHDVVARDNWDAEGRLERIRDAGLANSTVLRRTSRETGIEAFIGVLDYTDFNIEQPRVRKSLENLKLYRRKWNPKTGEYLGAEHDSNSHAADSYRYMAMAVNQIMNIDRHDEIKRRQSAQPSEAEVIQRILHRDPIAELSDAQKRTKQHKEYHSDFQSGMNQQTHAYKPFYS